MELHFYTGNWDYCFHKRKRQEKMAEQN